MYLTVFHESKVGVARCGYTILTRPPHSPVDWPCTMMYYECAYGAIGGVCMSMDDTWVTVALHGSVFRLAYRTGEHEVECAHSVRGVWKLRTRDCTYYSTKSNGILWEKLACALPCGLDIPDEMLLLRLFELLRCAVLKRIPCTRYALVEDGIASDLIRCILAPEHERVYGYELPQIDIPQTDIPVFTSMGARTLFTNNHAEVPYTDAHICPYTDVELRKAAMSISPAFKLDGTRPMGILYAVYDIRNAHTQ